MDARRIIFFLAFLAVSPALRAQPDEAAILKVILARYYQNEKTIVPGRLQLLSFYCKKAPNNEEMLEVIHDNPELKKFSREIKKQIGPQADEDWSGAYNEIFNGQNQYLKSKVNGCMDLESYQKYSTRLDLHNQRLLIVSKPIFFGGAKALVKITFYRNIEHNNGSVLLMQKTAGAWEIVRDLNSWST
jgi:hypothetical protein